MSVYQSNPSVPPARIAVLRHRRITPTERHQTVSASVELPASEPTYADFIGGPVDTRTTFATELEQVS